MRHCSKRSNNVKDKIKNSRSEVKFHKKMIDKTNQPYSYMIQDIERSEKELHNAQKKIKALEEEIRR